MLLRSAADGCIAITQPAHARLSGDLANAWGNAQFAAPSALERLAAAVHDIGWLDWETHPDFDADKGRPRTFFDMPVALHARLWEDGVRRAATISLLLGVLVSQHAASIYQRTFAFATADPADARLVRDFLDRQQAIRDGFVASLRDDARQADAVAPARLRYAQRLIATVDYMSLLICWGLTGAASIRDAPTSREAATTLDLSPGRDGEILISPWPFRRGVVRVAIEGRRLPSTMADESEMRRALAGARHVTIECALRPKTA